MPGWRWVGWKRLGWKWLGLAGVAGVAAGSVAIAREQRRRNSYTPDEIRARLRARVDGS